MAFVPALSEKAFLTVMLLVAPWVQPTTRPTQDMAPALCSVALASPDVVRWGVVVRGVMARDQCVRIDNSLPSLHVCMRSSSPTVRRYSSRSPYSKRSVR